MFVSSNQKKIIQQLADGQFHSGTELAETLGISRSAICKQIKSISDLGLDFYAISGKGYCLDYGLQLLSETEMDKYLTDTARDLIAELEIHDCIDSTNKYLLNKHQLLESKKEKITGLVCFAEYQSAGKGRRGRKWVSPFGRNIYLSILWRFQNGPAAISGLSLAVGVAVIKALNECGVTDVGLKWPNDIYWQDKKLGGILIEVSGEVSGPCHAVIGLGLNLYLSEQKAQAITQDWTDLKQILGDNAATIRNKLSAIMLNHLLPTIANFEVDTLVNYLQSWRDYDCMKGKEVNIFMGQHVFTGVIKGINNKGELLLVNGNNEIRTFASGEVSFRQS